MTEFSPELAAVEQLLAEGDALRGWLTRLDQGPSGASSLVRERVRSDYQQRLDQITAGLRAHADVVATKLSEDRSEHADLLARATAARDALAEAELRHAVGEYDAERFQGEQRRFGSDIETFDLSLAAAAERIARLEEVHALVERGPRPQITDFEADPVAEPGVVEVHTVTITDLAPDTTDVLAVFDEPGTSDQSLGTTNTTPTTDNGPLSFRPSGASGEWPRPVTPPARPRPFESAPPLGIPSADIPPRFVRPGERFSPPPAPPVSGAPATEPSQHGAPAREPEQLGPGSAPEVAAAPVGRTLRCGECGAMNRPLEWYCEKCGAELTAV